MGDAGCVCESLLQQAPACSWVIDAGYRFVRVYGNVRPIFGGEVLQGRSLSESLAADRARTWTGRVDRTLAGETLILREGKPAASWYAVQFPMQGAEGRRQAGGFALDITPWTTAEQELRYTVLGALRAQEFERSRMSKFLHDSVGQNLSAAGLYLDLVRMDLTESSPEVCARIAEIQQMLESMMQQVRDFSYELNPAMVERAGLHPALDRLLGRFRSRFHGALRLSCDPSSKIPERYATALYQIAQEAVENAVQHSGCSLIEIAVKSTKSGPVLEVRDNGKGFDPADVLGGRRGLGLLTMEHFAAQAGLEISISSARDDGTVVRAFAAEEGNS